MGIASMDNKITSVLQDIHQSLEEKEKKEKADKEAKDKIVQAVMQKTKKRQ